MENAEIEEATEVFSDAAALVSSPPLERRMDDRLHAGALPENLHLSIFMREYAVSGLAALAVDQRGNARPENELCDVGAIEKRILTETDPPLD
jgi:hypothetical protein